MLNGTSHMHASTKRAHHFVVAEEPGKDLAGTQPCTHLSNTGKAQEYSGQKQCCFVKEAHASDVASHPCTLGRFDDILFKEVNALFAL
jgi:hypothetical protein